MYVWSDLTPFERGTALEWALDVVQEHQTSGWPIVKFAGWWALSSLYHSTGDEMHAESALMLVVSRPGSSPGYFHLFLAACHPPPVWLPNPVLDQHQAQAQSQAQAVARGSGDHATTKIQTTMTALTLIQTTVLHPERACLLAP